MKKVSEESADAYYNKQPGKMNTYEAGESVKDMPIKQTAESHKKCSPGEFGMNKEGGAFAFGSRVFNKMSVENIDLNRLKRYGGVVPTPSGWDPKAGPLMMPPDINADPYPFGGQRDEALAAAQQKWRDAHRAQIEKLDAQRGGYRDALGGGQKWEDFSVGQEKLMYDRERAQAEHWLNKNRQGQTPQPAAAPPAASASTGGETIQQRLNRLNAARRAAGGEIPEGPGVVNQVDSAFARGAKSTSAFPTGGATTPPKPAMPAAPAMPQKSGAFAFGHKIAKSMSKSAS